MARMTLACGIGPTVSWIRKRWCLKISYWKRIFRHQRVQETGSESALYDEPAKWCGRDEILVEMKRIAVTAEFGESRHVFSGAGGRRR